MWDISGTGFEPGTNLLGSYERVGDSTDARESSKSPVSVASLSRDLDRIGDGDVPTAGTFMGLSEGVVLLRRREAIGDEGMGDFAVASSILSGGSG